MSRSANSRPGSTISRPITVEVQLEPAVLPSDGRTAGGTVTTHSTSERVQLPRLSYKGVEYTFLDSNRLLDLRDLECPICLELVFDPVQTSCGHLFCGKCIKDTDTCPVDRQQFTTTPDHFNERRLGNFKVKCPNSEKGCTWLGELKESEGHTGEICCYQMVKCTKGCEKEMERRQLMFHEANECLHRDFKCPHCRHIATYITVTTSHFTLCESFRLACVAGCKRTRTRKGMENHLDNTCPEELVECPHKKAGCTSIVKRANLQEHASDHTHHMKVLKEDHGKLYRCLQKHCQSRSQSLLDVSLLPLVYRPWLQNKPTCYPRPPWVIKMEGFQEKEENGIRWYSDPVYSHFGGYKLCLNVNANGHGEGENTHVSVCVHMMRGDNDDNLMWPFNGTVMVSLLNQLEDRQHCTKQLSPGHEDAGGRVPARCRQRMGRGWGMSPLISHQALGFNSVKNRQFLENDTLFMKVECCLAV